MWRFRNAYWFCETGSTPHCAPDEIHTWCDQRCPRLGAKGGLWTSCDGFLYPSAFVSRIPTDRQDIRCQEKNTYKANKTEHGGCAYRDPRLISAGRVQLQHSNSMEQRGYCGIDSCRFSVVEILFLEPQQETRPQRMLWRRDSMESWKVLDMSGRVQSHTPWRSGYCGHQTRVDKRTWRVYADGRQRQQCCITLSLLQFGGSW